MANFPHIADTKFPDIETVNVFDYQNNFDYARFDNAQMHITLCRVPWDMGEVHIGQRVIGGIGNVVHFGSAQERDEWFDAIPDNECIRFSTKYRALHRDNMIDLPITFEVASLFNYIAVEYVVPPTPGNPVEYATGEGIRKWFWFVREVEFRAVNTTRLHILPDTWQTFVYDMHITQMILDRGHAPMFETRAAYYLGAPANRSANLLAPDVNYGGEPHISRATSKVVLNTADNLQAVIVTSTAMSGDWGTKEEGDWTIPSHNQVIKFGVPNYRAYAIAAGNLSGALGNISQISPQFMQTVKCIFFIRGAYLTLGSAVEFCGSTFYNVANNGYVADTLYQIAKGDFGYAAAYADIAKLYTWPYACIKVYTEAGDTIDIHIEDTNGTLQLETCLNLAFPFVTIDAHLRGIGGASAANVSFQNATPETIPIGGNWYEFLHTWDIPTFAITQSAHKHNDYADYYRRDQMRLERDNRRASAYESADTVKTNADLNADAGKNNADASADAGKDNADASAGADKNNTDASADTINDNAALQVTANNALTTAGVAKMNADATQTQTYNSNMSRLSQTYNLDMATSQVTAANQQAAITAAMTSASGTLSSLTSMAHVTNASGAAQTSIGAFFASAQTIASVPVATGLTQVNAVYTNLLTEATKDQANLDTSVKNTNGVNYANAQRDANNDLVTDATANTATTMKDNAQRAYNAATGNATRNQTVSKANALRTQTAIKTAAANSRTTDRNNADRAYDTDSGRITESLHTEWMKAPKEFGAVQNAGHAMTRPLAMFATVVTQNMAHIMAAGDEFLRYGYMLGRRWDFTTWHYGKYFTYWKLQDFWVHANEIPDLYMDRLRMFFLEGVTIWKRPEDIGAVSIYDNYNEDV